MTLNIRSNLNTVKQRRVILYRCHTPGVVIDSGLTLLESLTGWVVRDEETLLCTIVVTRLCIERKPNHVVTLRTLDSCDI